MSELGTEVSDAGDADVEPVGPTDHAPSLTERDSIEARLAELQRESEARRAELRAIAAALPEVTSRRAQLRSITSSVVHTPDRTLVVKRALLKVARTPAALIRRLRDR